MLILQYTCDTLQLHYFLFKSVLQCRTTIFNSPSLNLSNGKGDSNLGHCETEKYFKFRPTAAQRTTYFEILSQDGRKFQPNVDMTEAIELLPRWRPNISSHCLIEDRKCRPTAIQKTWSPKVRTTRISNSQFFPNDLVQVIRRVSS